MKIIVDADACPRTALNICLRVAREKKVPLWTVASFNHNIESGHHVMVGNAPQEADLKILNLTQKDDLVVTQDWGLAAMVLGKQAACLSPSGKEFKPGHIDFLLEEREIKARYRRGGGRTRGPKKRNARDDQRLEAGLKRILDRGRGLEGLKEV